MEEKTMDSFLFIMLVRQYESSAYQFMGKIANPIDGKTERNLDVAKTFINILRMLKEKTSGNLTEEESKILETTLTNLQLNFMTESAKESPKHEEEKPDENVESVEMKETPDESFEETGIKDKDTSKKDSKTKRKERKTKKSKKDEEEY